MIKKRAREPIISVLGHVDHGKTTFLDWIRGTVIASKEAGGITQHIGATDVPLPVIKKICGHLLDRLKIDIEIRGLLFVDTPGHEAFTSLRRRGSSVADIAILVIDIMEGVMPQTKESIHILRTYKVPFVIAANKVDTIPGWNSTISLNKQQKHVRDKFYDKFYILLGQLSAEGFDCDVFDKISDFTKKIAIVPISAKTGFGIPNLLMVIIGLTRQYLAHDLMTDIHSNGRGTVLEVKKERGLGTTIDAIIYDGVMRVQDTIVVGSKEPIITKIKALLKPRPLDEIRDPREKFQQVREVYAASGVKIVAPNLENALAGSPVYVGGEEILKELEDDIKDIEIQTDKMGVILRADTIGSLEALIKILKEHEIPVRRATIGNVSNNDVIEASTVMANDRYLGVILAFNSTVLAGAREAARDREVMIFRNNVIYKLLEDYEEWVEREKERKRMEMEDKVVMPAKFRLLPKHTFRQSKPAIVGVEILAGVISQGCRIMRADGKVIGRIKGIQSGGKGIKSARAGDKVAMSIENVTVGRQINEGDIVYPFISSLDLDRINKEELNEEDKKILAEIIRIKKSK